MRHRSNKIHHEGAAVLELQNKVVVDVVAAGGVAARSGVAVVENSLAVQVGAT